MGCTNRLKCAIINISIEFYPLFSIIYSLKGGGGREAGGKIYGAFWQGQI